MTTPRRSPGMIQWVLVLMLMAGFVYHASIYWALTEDDAYISFRYARNLVQGHELVFNPGERVEGYSNFAWVGLAAAALRAGWDPVALAKFVGLVAGALSVLLSWFVARRLAPTCHWAALLAPVYLAVSPVLVQHATSGLETSFFALLVTACVLFVTGPTTTPRRILLLGTLVILALIRFEGVALVLLFLAAQHVLQKDKPGPRWLDLGVFLVVFLVYYVWRWFYFASLFPNTFHAKLSGGLYGIGYGIQYTLGFLQDSGGPLFVGLAAVPLLLGGGTSSYRVATGVLAAYLLLIVAMGGDWMFQHRFFAHILPILAAAMATGIHRLSVEAGRGQRSWLVRGFLGLVFAATLLAVGNTEFRLARILLPALGQHDYLSQNYAELGEWFQENSAPDASVAISDVGAVGYFSERKIIDMFGLIDPHIGRLRGPLHVKADPAYVLSREPEYIVLVSLNDAGAGSSFQRIPDEKMNGVPAFHADYTLISTMPMHWQNEFILVYKRRS